MTDAKVVEKKIYEDGKKEYAHSLALDLLKDKDGVYNIREYFLK